MLRVLPMIEAATLLVSFRIGLKVFPFRRLVSWIRPGDHEVQPELEAALVRRVRWAILAVSKSLPFVNICFPQALAAHFMLKRRGVPSILYYGVALEGTKLEAHTWLKANGHFVVGGERSPDYTVLTSFPAEGPKNSTADLLLHDSR